DARMRSCSRSAAGVCAAVRAGFAGLAAGCDAVWKRLMSPQAASVSAAHSTAGAAKRRRPALVPRRSTHPVTVVTSPPGLVADHFNLPRPEHLDPRSSAPFNPAADANPSIFEGLGNDARSLERWHHAS